MTHSKEVNGGTTIDGITYDGTVYKIEVKVLDNGVGGNGAFVVQLESIVKTVDDKTEEADTIEFTNKYTPAEIPETGDTADLLLWFTLLCVSGGAFFAMSKNGKKKKKEQQ